MDFSTGLELLKICETEEIPISEVMRVREIFLGECPEEIVTQRLDRVYEIMNRSIHRPIEKPERSMGGLIGGEAQKLKSYETVEGSVSGRLMIKAVAYSMAVLEANASMDLVVAAPTAGSSGVLPGVLIACMEEGVIQRKGFNSGILNAGAIGYILMRNASVSGAEAGCQAEVGAASAMAASALTELRGGTPAQCLQAATLAISNLLGLVCDPIAGLVEAPCQSRNSIGAANAIICADLALAGVCHQVPFDEMVDAMYRVGQSLPYQLRETAIGGCAGTPTGCMYRKRHIPGDAEKLRLDPLLKV